MEWWHRYWHYVVRSVPSRCVMPAARASAGALPLTAPPPWSSDLRGTTGGQQVTTHYWAESQIKSSLKPTTKPRQWGMNSGFPHPGCHCTPCAPAGYKSKLQFAGVPRSVPKAYINSPQFKTILSVLWYNNPGNDRPKYFGRWLSGEILGWVLQNRTKSMCNSLQKKQATELITTAYHYYYLL